MIAIEGPREIELTVPGEGPRDFVVRNVSADHRTFVDLTRGDTHKKIARLILEPGATQEIVLHPGVVTIALGASTRLEEA